MIEHDAFDAETGKAAEMLYITDQADELSLYRGEEPDEDTFPPTLPASYGEECEVDQAALDLNKSKLKEVV